LDKTQKHEDPDHRLPDRRDDAKEPVRLLRTATGKDPLSRYAAHLVVIDERPATRGRQNSFRLRPEVAGGRVYSAW
jgi:hypothetical protein